MTTPPSPARRTAYLLTFLTGASGLVYQVVWQRYLVRLLGGDGLATATVLGVFLAGLSLGFLICGRLSRRTGNLFRLYGLLEIGIGLWAVAFPWLFAVAERVGGTWAIGSRSSLVASGILFGVALLGPPTVLMGGTVPMLTRGLSRSVESATGVQARIYAINAFGAALGALAAGYLLIYRLGLPGTLRVAALVNVAAGIWFVRYGSRPGSEPVTGSAATGGATPTSPAPVRRVYAIALVAGFYFMTLETVMIRIANLTFGSSVRSFSRVVAVFVASIALGALLVARRKRIAPTALFLNQALVCISLMGLFLTLDRWPYWAHLLRLRFESTQTGFVWHQLASLALLSVLLVVPVALMGATLPLAFHTVKRGLDEVGSRAGSLFAWNALGNLLGGVIGGFVVYRSLHNGEVFLFALLLCALTALMAASWLPGSWRAAGTVLAVGTIGFALVFPSHDPLRFAVGTFRFREPLTFSLEGSEAFYEKLYASRNIVAYRDDPEGSFAVIEYPLLGVELARQFPDLASSIYGNLDLFESERARAIMVNGKPDSNTTFDRDTLTLLAHIPALLAEAPRRVLVVGLGTGVTVGELARHPGIESIDVAEIAPAVIDFLPLFAEATGGVHQDPRVHVRLGDAFQVIRREPQKWDLIISQPSNPWTSGIDQLFSREYYRLVRERLAEGGLFLQWTQRYATNQSIAAITLNTLLTEFPHVRVFRVGADDLLLGSTFPLGDDAFVRAESVLERSPRVRESLAKLGVDSVTDFLEIERPETVRAARARAELGIETLNRPRLHHLAGLAFYLGESLDSDELPVSP